MIARRRFRIETVGYNDDAKSNSGGGGSDRAEQRHREILDEIRSLKLAAQPAQEMSERVLDSFKREMAEAQKIKVELDSIYEAINRTKREIATLHSSGCNGQEFNRVTDELDAVVFGTEQATETILSSAEAIDERASDLHAKLNGDEQGMVSDIQDRVVQIFEACNFQDLSGQRITKVVNTLRFVEERIIRMMDIWGGIEGFKDIEVELEHRMGDQALLNGPSLGNDHNIASQDDIDALFG